MRDHAAGESERVAEEEERGPEGNTIDATGQIWGLLSETDTSGESEQRSHLAVILSPRHLSGFCVKMNTGTQGAFRVPGRSGRASFT